MPDKKYIKFYRTVELGNNKYMRLAILNGAGRKKFHRNTMADKVHIRGSKKTINI